MTTKLIVIGDTHCHWNMYATQTEAERIRDAHQDLAPEQLGGAVK